jgi:hypothetical protein
MLVSHVPPVRGFALDAETFSPFLRWATLFRP